MSQALIDYPSDTNRMTKVASPGDNLNGSAAALNASIKALTDAIAAAQALLATLAYTGATENVDLNGKDLTNIGTSGDTALAVNAGAATSLKRETLRRFFDKFNEFKHEIQREFSRGPQFLPVAAPRGSLMPEGVPAAGIPETVPAIP